jgi:hypothetical protein
MRELTKSVMSFSWAMSLLGAQQMARLIMPQTWGQGTSNLDSVTRSTESQLGSVTQSMFKAGDSLQRGMIDMMFGMLDLGNSTSSVWERAADAVRRAGQGCGGCGQAAPPPGMPSQGGAGPGEPGWGPMPGGR